MLLTLAFGRLKLNNHPVFAASLGHRVSSRSVEQCNRMRLYLNKPTNQINSPHTTPNPRMLQGVRDTVGETAGNSREKGPTFLSYKTPVGVGVFPGSLPVALSGQRLTGVPSSKAWWS